MSKSPHITLVGCGKMGSALLSGWLNRNPNHPVAVLDPQGLPEEFQDKSSVRHFASSDNYIAEAPETDIFVLAVKPQIIKDVSESIADAVPHDALVISIAAGTTIGNLESFFNTSQPVVRAMPNTPAAIGKGVTVAVSNDRVSRTQKQQALNILSATGEAEWIADENLMDAVTAISGSGPAYFYRFTEALAEAGKKLGLSEELANKLARKTFEGSAALAESDHGTDIGTLRENVTSPGGTTEAALKDMDDNNKIQKLVDEATRAAEKRGRELSR